METPPIYNTLQEKMQDIRLQGEIDALKKHIDKLIFSITHTNFNNNKNDQGFLRLGEAMKQVRENLREMEVALEELQSLQPHNK